MSDTITTTTTNSTVNITGGGVDVKPTPTVEDTISKEHWFSTYYRPAAGWAYLIICLFDFVVFPFMSMIIPIVGKYIGYTIVYAVWSPLTLQGAGTVHLSFGAIIGVGYWTKGQENVAKINAP